MSEPLEVKTCVQCGRPMEATAAVCGNCWTPTTVASRVASDPKATTTSPSFPSPQAKTIARRYGDAYSVAASIIAHGQRLKLLALIIGGLIAILTLTAGGGAAQEFGAYAVGPMVLGLLASVFVGSSMYSNGIRITAEGQQLLASLDVAVNTSPFLNNSERADVMRL